MTYGDVAAISALSAVVGGFLSAALWVSWMFGPDYWVEQPLSAVGTVVFSGFLGVIFGFVIAWPVGLIFGSLILRFSGSSTWHAVLGGALTAFTLVVLAFGRELFVDPGSIGFALMFSAAGGALASLARWYLLTRVAVFGEIE